MRFLHTGDLHIGKSVNEFSMIEEQHSFLNQMIEIVQKEKLDAVVLAGDIYDRAIPSTQAVGLLDAFLSQLCEMSIPVLMISGNHDSPERVGFANRILEKQGLYIASTFTDTLQQVHFQDEYGCVNFVLMPYVKPAVIQTSSCEEAVHKMLDATKLQDTEARNVLVTHYFVIAGSAQPELSDSESMLQIGGLDVVEEETFSMFDYVALGHIHKPQKIGQRAAYYAGSPIKYSFSETRQHKSVQIVTLGAKGCVEVTPYPITPLHDMRKIQGKLADLMQEEVLSLADRNDYIQATLTDEAELLNPMDTLRSVYPNMMQILLAKNELNMDKTQLLQMQRSKTILEIYDDFYTAVKDAGMDEERREIVIATIREAEGEKDL
ncbi:MAG: exonuclease SbcCD subunit D [Lachnospiraceae bacterium]